MNPNKAYSDAINYLIQQAEMDMRKEIKEQLTPLIEDIAELKTRQYLLEQATNEAKSLAQLYDELEKMEEEDERKL